MSNNSSNGIPPKDLGKSMGKFETLFRALPVGVTVLDFSGIVFEMNPEMEKIFGIKKSELIGKSFFQHVQKQNRGLVNPKDTLERLAKGEPSVIKEIKIKMSNGNYRYIRNHVSYFKEIDGKVMFGGGQIKYFSNATSKQGANGHKKLDMGLLPRRRI